LDVDTPDAKVASRALLVGRREIGRTGTSANRPGFSGRRRAQAADPARTSTAIAWRSWLWALRSFSPIVALDPPDGLVIDAVGAAHLRGGEAAYVEDLVQRLANAGVARSRGHERQLGFVPCPGPLRGEPIVVVDSAESGRTVAGLPIAALRLPAETVDGLSKGRFDIFGVRGQAKARLATVRLEDLQLEEHG
jgi:hypothetical protein